MGECKRKADQHAELSPVRSATLFRGPHRHPRFHRTSRLHTLSLLSLGQLLCDSNSFTLLSHNRNQSHNRKSSTVRIGPVPWSVRTFETRSCAFSILTTCVTSDYNLTRGGSCCPEARRYFPSVFNILRVSSDRYQLLISISFFTSFSRDHVRQSLLGRHMKFQE